MAKGHYIPQFYLRLFINQSDPTQELFYYNISTKRWNKKGVGNIGFEDDYYILTDTQNNVIDSLEKAFKNVEEDAAPIIKDKILRRQSLSDIERHQLAIFIGLMRVRVPSFIDMFSEYSSRVLKSMMAQYQGSPEAFDKLKRDFEDETGKQLPEDFTRDAFNPELWEIDSSEKTKSIIFDAVPKLAASLALMNWTFLIAPNDSCFITTDNPFYLSEIARFGLESKENYVTLPLSSRVCFFASWQGVREMYLDVDAETVRGRNAERILIAKQYLFSSEKTFPGYELLTTS